MFNKFSRSAVSRSVSSLRKTICASHPQRYVRCFHYAIVNQNETTPFNATAPTIKTKVPITNVEDVKESSTIESTSNSKSLTGSELESLKSAEFVPVEFSEFRGKGIIDDVILDALEDAGFHKLTPIQQKSLLPILNTEKGLVCRAKTGTGKTLAFIIPTLVRAMRSKEKGVSSLVIAPTRDLALQIKNEYLKIIRQMPERHRPRLGMVIGKQTNVFNVRYPEKIVIATPGRLEADLRANRRFSSCFSNLDFRVYDEADKLLDTGFERNLDNINDMLKDCRTTLQPLKSLLLSATLNEQIEDFAKVHIHRKYEFLNTVESGDADVHENVHQIVVRCEDSIDKIETFVLYMANLMKTEDSFRVLVFLPTKTSVDWIAQYFDDVMGSDVVDGSFQYSAAVIHGDKTLSQRQRALNRFKKHDRTILFATDVVARGIDVKGVTHVCQLAPSYDTADYVHKAGRTGRNGANGTAFLFATSIDKPFLRQLEKDIKGGFNKQVISKDVEFERLKFVGKIESDYDAVCELFIASMAYFGSLASKYRMDVEKLVKNSVMLYRGLIKDDEAKINEQYVKVFRRKLSKQTLRKYFEGVRSSNHGPRGHDRDDYDRYLSYGRRGNSRNYDRGYGSGRNDRRSKRSFDHKERSRDSY
ncbi:MAG: DEAD/DEAH box helicase [Asgard group archaeon]|nr:DEAD/DEAH box helicase [Asgard group archaeon]